MRDDQLGVINADLSRVLNSSAKLWLIEQTSYDLCKQLIRGLHQHQLLQNRQSINHLSSKSDFRTDCISLIALSKSLSNK